MLYNILNIKKEAFADNYLEYIEFSHNLEYIGDEAFSTNRLTEVDLGNNVTISDTAFIKNKITTLNQPSRKLIISDKTEDALYSSYDSKIKNLDYF